MEIFLVRHGETGGNLAHRHQAVNTPLTKKGEEQALQIADFLREHNPTHLLTSNMVRAVETASIVGDHLGLVPETSELFIELERPDYLYGHYHKSFRSIEYYMRWYLNFKAPGESYRELRERFRLAQEFLSQYPEDSKLVVVSHAVFITLFTAHLCRDKSLTPLGAALAFRKILTIPNVHTVKISHQKNGSKESCCWSVDR